jgi:hypothetical protein
MTNTFNSDQSTIYTSKVTDDCTDSCLIIGKDCVCLKKKYEKIS